MNTPFRDEQEMLTLALASYRGFSKVHLDGGAPGAGLVDDAFLAELEPLGGRWKLAWGPGTHHPRLGLIDDAMMFVARDVARDEGRLARLAVVIRGTNPVSAPDWIFGGLWAAHTIPWRGGGAGERVSLSTSLGLSVLQGMRGEPREQGRSFFSAAVKAGVNALLAPVEQGLAERLRALRAGVRALASEVVPAAALDDAARAEALLAARASGAWAALGAAVDGAAALAENELTFDLYRFLEDGERLRALSAKGQDVATFLRAQTDGGQPVEVWVTGHSKGAALAPGIEMPDALQRLAAAVAGEVKALDYRHVDARASRFAGTIDASASGFLPQVIHQHLEAYIERAGLSGPLTRARLFGSGAVYRSG